MRARCASQTAGRLRVCVCVSGEALSDVTLENCCYNVNIRAACSAGFATDLLQRARE